MTNPQSVYSTEASEDGSVPADADWVAEQGFSFVACNGSLTLGHLRYYPLYEDAKPEIWYRAGMLLRHPTRGQIRHLIAALEPSK